MEQVGPVDYVVATYEEIRLRFGLGGTDQARIKAKRRKWAAEPVNHPGAVTRIRAWRGHSHPGPSGCLGCGGGRD
jgi:cytochrome b